jgi:hypothetical protein
MTLMFLFFLFAAGLGAIFRLFIKPRIMAKLGMTVSPNLFGLPMDFDGMLRQMDQIIRAQQAMAQGGQVNQAPVDPRFAALMAQYHNGLRQIDDIHRQRYEMRVSEIQGMAAQFGWSIDTPSWR